MNSYLLLIAGILIILSAFASRISTRFGIPVLLIFMGIGILAGPDFLNLLHFDSQETASTIANIALMFILFDSGSNTKKANLHAFAGPSLTLATFGILATTLILGFLIHILLDQDILFSLMLGAIISSTDAAAVMTVLRERPIQKKISSTLEIESAANDPMAILLTLFMINLIQNAGNATAGDYVFFVLQLIWQFAGGILIAFAASKIGVKIYNHFKSENLGLFYVLYIGILFATYSSADLLKANGIIAIFFAGYWLGNQRFVFKRGVSHFVSALSSFANMCVFLLLGILVVPHLMINVWWEGIILAIVLIFIARPLAVLLSLLPFKYKRKEQTFIAWGGLKGAVPVVLATYPAAYGLDPDNFVFNIVFFVVTLSCLIQGTTLSPFAKTLGFSVPKNRHSPYFMELFSLAQTNFEVMDVQITETAPYDIKTQKPWHKSKIKELTLKRTQEDPEEKSENSSVVITAIVRNKKIISPNGETRLKSGDILFLLGTHESLEEFVPGQS